MEQEENHANSPRWSWAKNQMGNVSGIAQFTLNQNMNAKRCVILIITLAAIAGSQIHAIASAFTRIRDDVTHAAREATKSIIDAKNSAPNSTNPANAQGPTTAATLTNMEMAATNAIALIASRAKDAADQGQKLETREKFFSATVLSLFISNGLTLAGLVAGRKKAGLTLKMLQLEVEEKEIQLRKLRM